METNNTLRGTDAKILKNVTNPVMFLGYPLKLAFFHIGAILLGSLLAFLLNSIEASILITILIPLGVIIIGLTSVSVFYKKYGVNGFELTQRHNNLFKHIEGDVSILMAVRDKIKENGKVK